MTRSLALLTFLWAVAGCSVPALDVEGKGCSAVDPCPSAYACLHAPGATRGACARAARLQVRTGTYLGGAASTVSVGFAPALVIVKGDTTSAAVMRTRTMGGTFSKHIGNFDAGPSAIVALNADGFGIGTSAHVNEAGVAYHWTAFAEGAGTLVAGSYLGSGGGGQIVDEVGFAADWLWVLPEQPLRVVFRTPSLVGDAALPLDANDVTPNWIRAIRADGFEVGTPLDAASVTYHYVAISNAAAGLRMGTYLGDGGAGREIAEPGAPLEYLLIKGDSSAVAGVHRPRSLSGDLSLGFSNTLNVPGAIEALTPSGFRIGAAPIVNTGGVTYYWVGAVRPETSGGDYAVGCGAAEDGRPIQALLVLGALVLRARRTRRV